MIKIVGVFIATGNGQNARAQNVRQRVSSSGRIAPIAARRRQLIGDRQVPLRQSEQHYTTIGT
jgi:hypothetical protein